MSDFYNAFISYGRADSKVLAANLHNRLTELNYRVWFDINDIPVGVDYQKQIDDGIERAHNFLFIISPHAVNSDYCRLEIEQAVRFNKRIIPLLHVCSIDHETWQQRHPNGTEEEWTSFIACNHHRGDDKNPNMHPTIAKINWVPFVEDCDDFEASLAKLLTILNQHKDYVEQHTDYLVKALWWWRNQKQARYLLFQDDRQKAEAWLKFPFSDEQPPCTPIDLQCEYITESKKNSQNLMTQVFLAHANEDVAAMDTIRRSLRRTGITVWVSSTDIESGEDFQRAIDRGIEQADNIVYLLSPDAQASSFCRHELEYALSLHKRIIPILICPTDESLIPQTLRDLQYIDLTTVLSGEDDQKSSDQLLRVLNEDASYFEEHKILLSQAIKWDQSDRNPSMLLRGYNLNHATAWLKTAQLRTQYRPTPLQVEFIHMSRLQPPAQALDVFVSYSRYDSDFARSLNEQLQLAGKRTWFDLESIASGANFQYELEKGIENSDNFLFVISPRSLASSYCAGEIEHAIKFNKRIVTVLHRQVDVNTLHEGLKDIQWIDFETNRGDSSASFKELIRTLDTDPQHLRAHTRLLVQAIEWDSQGRSDSLLLRGEEIDYAEQWLGQTAEKEPLPTGLQRDFIGSSRSSEQAQQRATQILKDAAEKGRRRVLFGTITMGVALAIASIASVITARVTGELKVFNALESLENDADNAMRQASFDQLGGLMAAVEAAHELQTIAPKHTQGLHDYGTARPFLALQQNLYGTDHLFVEQNRLTLENRLKVVGTSLDSDNQILSTVFTDGVIETWNFSGQQQPATKPYPPLQTAATRGEIYGLSAGGQFVVAVEGSQVKIWSVSDLKRAPNPILEHETRLAQNEQDIHAFNGIAGQVVEVSLKSDDFDTYLEVRDENGTLLVDNDDVDSSHNSALNLIIPADGTYQIIARGYDESASGQYQLSAHIDHALKTILNHDHGTVSSIGFSPDGNYVAIASERGDVEIWTSSGELKQRFFTGFQDVIKGISLSNDQQTVVTVSGDGTVRFWDVATLATDRTVMNATARLEAASAGAYSLDGRAGETIMIQLTSDDFDTVLQLAHDNGDIISENDDSGTSTNSTILETFPEDGVYQISAAAYSNEMSGQYQLSVTSPPSPAKTISGYRARDIQFSSDNKYIMVVSNDGIVYVLNRDGQLIQDIIGHQNPITNLAISADGTWIATLSDDDTARFWHQTQSVAEDWTHSQNLFNHPFAISRDYQHIATAMPDGLINVWNFGQEQWRDPTALLPVLDVGGRLENGGKKDPSGSGSEHVFEGQEGQSLAIRLESSDFDPTLMVFDESGALIAENDDADANTLNSALDVILPADGTYKIVATAYSGEITGQYQLTATPLPNLRAVLGNQSNSYTSLSFSADGQQIAGALPDGNVQVWSMGGELQHEFPTGHTGQINSLTFSPVAPIIATASQDGSIMLWDLTQQNRELPPILETSGALESDDLRLSSRDTLYDEFPIEGTVGQHISVQLESNEFDTYLMIEDDEGNALAENDDDEASTNSSLDITLPSDRLSQIIVTAYDGSMSGEYQLRVLPFQDPIQVINRHEGPVTSVSFSADGQFILSASRDGTAQLWNLAGDPQQSFLGHQGWVTHAQFSPEGQQVLTTSRDGTVRLWSTSGDLLQQLSFDIGTLIRAFFFLSDDRQQIVAVTQDGRAQGWPLYTPEELLILGCDRLRYYLNSQQIRSSEFGEDLSKIQSICESR